MIEIFISSTFGEFQNERDLLKTYIKPQLARYAKEEFSESVHFMDLRWGIVTDKDTAGENMEKVLEVCFNRIETSRIFLGLLGDAYGSNVSTDILKNVMDSRRIPDFDTKDERSVTHLEFEYSLRDPGRVHLFCFRRNTEHTDVRTQRIKSDLAARFPDRVFSYSGEDTHSFYTRELLEILKREVAQLCRHRVTTDWYTRSHRHGEYMTNSLHNHISDMIYHHSVGYVEQASKLSLLILRGAEGIGKSTYIAAMDEVLSGRNVDHITVYADEFSAIQTHAHLLRYLLRFCGIPVDEEMSPDSMKALLCKVKTPFYLLIDNAEELADSDSSIFSFLPYQLPEDFHIIMTCGDRVELPLRLPFHPESKLEQLPFLDAHARGQAIEYFQKKEGKELPPNIRRYLEENPQVKIPHHLELIFLRYLILERTDYQAITDSQMEFSHAQERYFIDILNQLPTDIGPLSYHILSVACGQFGSGELLTQAIRYMALTNHGLREFDLEGLLSDDPRWSAAEFNIFIQYMKVMFIRSAENHMDFTHGSLKQSVLDTIVDQRAMAKRLLDWLDTLGEGDSVRYHEYLTMCYLAGDFGRLAGYLSGVDTDDKALVSVLADQLTSGQMLRTTFEVIDSIPADTESDMWMVVLAKVLSEIPTGDGTVIELVLALLKKLLARSDEPAQQEGFTFDQALTYCGVAQILGKYQTNLSHYQEAIDVFDSLCDIYTQLLDFDDMPEQVMKSVRYNFYLCMKSLLFCYERDHQEEKAKGLRILVKSFAEHFDLGIEAKSSVSIQTAVVDAIRGEKESAIKNLLSNIAMLESAENRSGKILSDLITSYNNLAGIYLDAQEYQTALKYYNEAYRLAVTNKNQEANLYIVIDNMAKCYNGLGKPEEALKIFRKTTEFWLRTATEEGNDFLFSKLYNSYRNIAASLHKLHRHEEAVAAMEEGIAIVTDMVCHSRFKDHLVFFTRLFEHNYEDREVSGCWFESAFRIVGSDFDINDEYVFFMGVLFKASYHLLAKQDERGITYLQRLEKPLKKCYLEGKSVTIGIYYASLLEQLAEFRDIPFDAMLCAIVVYEDLARRCPDRIKDFVVFYLPSIACAIECAEDAWCDGVIGEVIGKFLLLTEGLTAEDISKEMRDVLYKALKRTMRWAREIRSAEYVIKLHGFGARLNLFNEI